MSYLLQFFDINNIFFTLLGYPISYLEFSGTIFNLASVWLVARKHILNWPVGLIGVILFGALFYQINLYADLFEQVYYFITGIWGWYMWRAAARPSDGDEEIVVRRNSYQTNLYWLIAAVAGTIAGTWAMTHLNIWWPQFFPRPASLPLLDTATTIVSFIATILMMQRKLECWLLWISVDIVAVWLYWHKQVPFIALLYLVFMGIATSGFITWLTTYRREHHETRTGHRQILSTASGA